MLSFFKAVFKRISLTSGLLLIVWFLFTGRVFADVGIVSVDLLNLRPQPGIEGSPVKVLTRGTRVKILGEKGNWLWVRHEKDSGYIRNFPHFLHVLTTDKNSENQDDKDRFRRLEEEAKKLDQKIARSKADIKTFTEKERTILERLDAIEQKINDSRERAAEMRDELSKLDTKIDENFRRMENISKKVASLHEYAKKRMVALYKMNRIGTLSILASADSISDFFLRSQGLERVLIHDEAARNQLISEQLYLRELTARLSSQRKTKAELEQKLRSELKILNEEKQSRAQLLENIRRDKSLENAALEAFKQAAVFIGKKIKGLEQKRSGPKPETFQSEKPFSALKGLLKLPAKGRISLGFGPYWDEELDVEHFSNGIDIRAELGEPIRAVGDGRIIFAAWFQTYGNMIIIDHGFHFYTVYAHAQELFKSKGDRVESGEVIATVGDTGSISGPKLYFEVRHHGKPVDPSDWIHKG